MSHRLSDPILSPELGFHRRFNPKASSSFRPNGTKLAIQYGSGQLTGILSQDNLTVGDFGHTRLQLRTQGLPPPGSGRGLKRQALMGEGEGILERRWDPREG